MKRTDNLVALNQVHIRQGMDLLASLTDEQYTATRAALFPSGVGEHMRHIVEHYQLFLDGLASGRVDYDARKRDDRISSSRSFAIDVMGNLIDDLNAIDSSDAALEIKMAASHAPDSSSPLSNSTILRELQYLQAHTIHHYALIAIILRIQGVEPTPDFGVAPSTLQHRASLVTGSRT
ncbi:MAG: hypothetical protein COV99_10300 [Bacteroidetes bacterium CG12_big_fil_rev_8_21_14_0_65_60_17]|nr:MAG: hypothetical protein COV99_10300 [Bacteroidetes bacterium CG12_big_fil_rev_8_21_14_0_65_60_17]